MMTAPNRMPKGRTAATISRRRMRFMRPVADLIDDGLGGIDTRSPWFAVVATVVPHKYFARGWSEGTGQVPAMWPNTCRG